MKSLQKNLERLLMSNYLNHKIVLLIDLVVSIACTLLSYFIVSTLTGIPILPHTMLSLSAVSLLGAIPAFYLLKTYRHVIRHSTLADLWRIGFSVVAKELVMFLLIIFFVHRIYLVSHRLSAFILFDMLFCAISLVFIRMAMVQLYDMIKKNRSDRRSKSLILIYGKNNDSAAMVKRMSESKKYQVAGFIVFGHDCASLYLAGLPVYCFRQEEDFNKLISRKDIKGILFARYDQAQAEKDRLIVYCAHAGIKTYIAPPSNEVSEGHLFKVELQRIKIEDLLGREEIHIRMEEVVARFKGKDVMVTGAAGSIGSELCLQLATFGIKKLILFDSAETPMHELRLELERKFPQLDFVPIVGDVRIKQRVETVFDRFRPQVVFHAAAYKHVPLMEENPCEAVLVNVIGSKQVADMAVKYGAEMMIMISTDKAVNPTNVMGCSKRLAEIYVQSLGKAMQEGTLKGTTKFVTTRFGNVLGSNGSVIPLFRSQIERGGPVTVTHRDIIRFFMTIPEACRLVMKAATLGSGNDIFVFEMGEPVKIADLAKRMIELAGYIPDKDIQIEYTGLRPGEKLFEEVLSNEENTARTTHDKILIAKVRDYCHKEIAHTYAELEKLSRAAKIDETVRLMKQTVPEFISQNSRFELLDQELADENRKLHSNEHLKMEALEAGDAMSILTAR